MYFICINRVLKKSLFFSWFEVIGSKIKRYEKVDVPEQFDSIVISIIYLLEFPLACGHCPACTDQQQGGAAVDGEAVAPLPPLQPSSPSLQYKDNSTCPPP